MRSAECRMHLEEVKFPAPGLTLGPLNNLGVRDIDTLPPPCMR